MNELELKYGCNPNQRPSRIYMKDGSDLPVTVLSGTPGYINFLDALNSWQLVRELRGATGLPAAASFKHVSPAGAAVGLPLSDVDRRICFVDDEGELAQQFQIVSIPTLILFKDGKPAHTMVGNMPKADLVKELEANL